MVLAFRMCYYIAVIDLYTELNKYRYTFTSHVRPSYFAAYVKMYNTGRHIAILFTCADYQKFALGFFQLASMAELALVIR